MKHRKLRIAWSVAWGIVAVLLIALWVRSEHLFDAVGSVMSAQGRLYLSPQVNFFPTDRDAAIETYKLWDGAITTVLASNVQVTSTSGTGPIIPFWAPLLATFLVAALPWLPWRFSLRTLLIVTTVVAVGLGLIVWLL